MKSTLAAVKRQKVPYTGQPTSARSIYSWSRLKTHHLPSLDCLLSLSNLSFDTLATFRSSLGTSFVDKKGLN